MNALSALRTVWPSLAGTALPSSASSAAVTPQQTIPASELRSLAPAKGGLTLSPSQPTGSSFSNVLGQLVQDVNAKQMQAGDMVRALQGGEDVSLHQAVIAMEEASVSYLLMVEVRNKLLESYQELMRMQV